MAEQNKLDTPPSRAATYARGVITAVTNAIYSPTVQSKVAQGSAEVSNALFNQSTAYSPYTADNAYRAKFQSNDNSRGMER